MSEFKFKLESRNVSFYDRYDDEFIQNKPSFYSDFNLVTGVSVKYTYDKRFVE